MELNTDPACESLSVGAIMVLAAAGQSSQLRHHALAFLRHSHNGSSKLHAFPPGEPLSKFLNPFDK